MLEKLWIPVNELILRQKGEPVVHLADALIATVPDGQPSLLSSLFGLLTAHFIPLESPGGAALFPEDFCMADADDYFIHRKVTDMQGRVGDAKDLKSISKHAKPLFKCGLVQKLQVCARGGAAVVGAKCLPEMKQDTVYHLQLVLEKKDGTILSASCQCPAGAGPRGSCKHLAALCYALQYFVVVGFVKDFQSCTDMLQTWNQTRKSRVPPARADDIFDGRASRKRKADDKENQCW